MLTMKIPNGMIEVIDRDKKCLWSKIGEVYFLAASHMVYKPKIKACLVIINLKVRNTALLLKRLHFYNKPDARWVQLIKDTHYHEVVPHVVVLSGFFGEGSD
jgi:hypothetical protein